jgi:hypothetical protein
LATIDNTPGALKNLKNLKDKLPDTLSVSDIEKRLAPKARETVEDYSDRLAKLKAKFPTSFEDAMLESNGPDPTSPEEQKKREHKSFHNGVVLSKVLHASHTKLEPVEIARAHLTKASGVTNKKSVEAAQKYLDDHGMGDYKIDPELSNKEGLVVQGPDGVELAWRGTDVTSLADLKANLGVAAGRTESTKKVKRGQSLFDAAETKYGEGSVKHVSGFSLGSAPALVVGRQRRTDHNI